MKLYRQIDEDGYFIGDVLAEAPLSRLLDVEPARGLVRPRWNGHDWEEGASEEELAASPEIAVAPTLEKLTEEVQLMNEALLACMLLLGKEG